MTRRSGRSARPRVAVRSLLAATLACAGATAPLAAQVRDTAAAARDTIPADSLAPPPTFTQLGSPWAERRAASVWHFDRDALLASGAFSLLELLDRIPSVVTLRAGMFLQPEVASAFGGTSPRVEIEQDGFILDPYTASALDLSTIELAGLTEVLVERRLDLLRIRFRTAAARDPRPYSRVEAAVGQPDANLFRGILLVPRLLVGPFGFAVERLDTDGAGGAEPADVFDGWVKWGWLGESRGLQLELRQSALDRNPRSPWIETRRRRDLVVRARNRFAEGIAAEAYLGESHVDVEPTDTFFGLPDSLRAQPFERSGLQGGVRASFARSGVAVDAGLRARDEPELPRLQADVGVGAALAGRLSVRGDLAVQSWRDADATSSLDLRADAGPFGGIVPFGEWTTGKRGAPLYGDTSRAGPLIEDRTAFRVGAEALVRGVRAGGAFVRVETDSVPAFRQPFDSAARHFAGGAVSGWEAFGRLPLLVDWLALDGSFLRWTSGARWVYMPAVQWRAGLELHAIPLPSGNLEIFGRAEAVHRGEMAAPAATGAGLETMAARTVYSSYLQIRIMDVRIFVRSDDMLGADAEDLPGRRVPGPRLIYGVKWQFWN